MIRAATLIIYERHGNKVMPLRVTKEWLKQADGTPKFVKTRVTAVDWRTIKRERPPLDITPSVVKVPALDDCGYAKPVTSVGNTSV